MASSGILHASLKDALLPVPVHYNEVRWYAAHTTANHEKCVAEQLAHRLIEQFLPVYESVRFWKDRRKLLQLPLFPGYVFVRLALRNRLQVLQIPSVVRLVGFNGTPTPLFDEEVESLRRALAHGVRAEPHPYLMVGRSVLITTGPLAGRKAILVRNKGRKRIVISTELIQRSIMLDIDASQVVPIQTGSAMSQMGDGKFQEAEFSAAGAIGAGKRLI